MRILHVIRTIHPTWGGPVQGIAQLGTTLVSEGHQVEVACLDAPGSPWHKIYPLPVHAVGPGQGVYGFGPRWVPWMKENLHNYDVVVMNGIWQYHSFGTWRVLRKTDIPYMVFVHGMLDPWFKRRHPLKHIKKWMYWPWAEYRVLRDAKAVLFTTEEERLLARQSFWLYDCKEVVVGYGTSRPKGDPVAQARAFFSSYPELRGKRLALYLGRLHPRKGGDLALKAFATALGSDESWQLVMAGPDGAGWKSKLVQMAERAAVSNRITWIDMLSGDVKWGAIRAAEFLLLPSHGENFGIVVAEALACGTPVLISDKVNVWREIQAGKAGLIAADTLEGACSLINTWLTMSDADRTIMKAATSECFQRHFEIGKAARNMAQAVADWLDSTRRTGGVATVACHPGGREPAL